MKFISEIGHQLILWFYSFGSISLPQKEDPRHTHLIKRCENARPIGMFRSTDDEFLLCYDGMLILVLNSFLSTNLNEQNSAFTWINMVIRHAQATPSNGKELQNELHSISLSSFFSILALSRYGMSRRVGLRRSFRELMFDVPGMDEVEPLLCVRILR